MRLLPGITSPLANRGAGDIDMICVRENSEGEYCGIGGRLHGGTPYELAEQTAVFTRLGIGRSFEGQDGTYLWVDNATFDPRRH